MLNKVEQVVLGALYTLAYRARDIYWSVRKPTLIGVWALVLRGDEVLLVRHRSIRRGWTLPGGGVERMERLQGAAQREVLEECGVSARVEHLLGVYDLFRNGYTNYIAVFVCSTTADARPPRSVEIADARFFRLEALPADMEAGSLRRIAEHRAGKRGLSGPW